MVSSTLTKKIVRDLLNLKAQVISISVVVAIGIGVLFGFTSTRQSLQTGKDHFYQSAQFADLFVELKKAPIYVADRLRLIQDVMAVETRLKFEAPLSLAFFDEPVMGQFISLPEAGQPEMNQLFLKQGRLPSPKATDEVAVNEAFFLAHNLKLGDRLTATLNGRAKELTLVGVGISPEFLMVIQPGSPLPDDLHFAILWTNESVLAGAYDMKAAFNNALFKISPAARSEKVLSQIDQILEPYGAAPANERDQLLSHMFITQELEQLEVQAETIPVIFLLVAAYILNVVIFRLVNSQRAEIATLKALGYFNRNIGWHYFWMAGVVVGLGGILGIAFGFWIGQSMIGIYSNFFKFPYLTYDFTFMQIFISVFVSLITAALGVYTSLRHIFKLSTAEAMRPPTPPSFHKNPIEKLAWIQKLNMQMRMVVRGLIASPRRSLLTTLGTSMTIVLLISSLFWLDSLDYLIYSQYGLIQRETASVTLTKALSPSVVKEVEHMTGVLEAEGYYIVPVKVSNGAREETTSLRGVPDNMRLHQLINDQRESFSIPPGGFYITEILARKLNVQLGNIIEVEAIEGAKSSMRLPVRKIIDSFMSGEILAHREDVTDWLKEGDRVNQILFRSSSGDSDLHQKLKEMPHVRSVTYKKHALETFTATSANYILTLAIILSLCAGAIGFGITYNNAQVALTERDWELATLQILGFKVNEVFWILFSEIAVLILVCLPIGWIIGYFNAKWLLSRMSMEAFQIPFVFDIRTFFIATVVLILSASLSGWVIYRKITKMDFVATLKSRG